MIGSRFPTSPETGDYKLWTTKEKLVLASCIQRMRRIAPQDSFNWLHISESVGGIFKCIPHLNHRPAGWFSQKNCVGQYEKLLDEFGGSQGPWREDPEAVQSFLQNAVDQLTKRRKDEVFAEMEKTKKQYKVMLKDYEDLKSGRADHRIDEMDREVDREAESEKILESNENEISQDFEINEMVAKVPAMNKEASSVVPQLEKLSICKKMPVVELTDIFAQGNRRKVINSSDEVQGRVTDPVLKVLSRSLEQEKSRENSPSSTSRENSLIKSPPFANVRTSSPVFKHRAPNILRPSSKMKFRPVKSPFASFLESESNSSLELSLSADGDILTSTMKCELAAEEVIPIEEDDEDKNSSLSQEPSPRIMLQSPKLRAVAKPVKYSPLSLLKNANNSSSFELSTSEKAGSLSQNMNCERAADKINPVESGGEDEKLSHSQASTVLRTEPYSSQSLKYSFATETEGSTKENLSKGSSVIILSSDEESMCLQILSADEENSAENSNSQSSKEDPFMGVYSGGSIKGDLSKNQKDTLPVSQTSPSNLVVEEKEKDDSFLNLLESSNNEAADGSKSNLETDSCIVLSGVGPGLDALEELTSTSMNDAIDVRLAEKVEKCDTIEPAGSLKQFLVSAAEPTTENIARDDMCSSVEKRIQNGENQLRVEFRSPEKSQGLSKAQRKILVNMVEHFKIHKHSSIFLKPVNVSTKPIQARVVKRPMDLHTLRRKVESGNTMSLEEFQRDLRLMFLNAVMFNTVQSGIPERAIAMEKECFTTLSVNLAAQWNSETKRSFNEGIPEDMEHLGHFWNLGTDQSLTPAASTRKKVSGDMTSPKLPKRQLDF